MGLSVIIVLMLTGLNYTETMIWFAPVGLVALSYTLTVFPYHGGWVRLRDIPYLKVFLIVAAVTYVTCCLPFLYYGLGEVTVGMPAVLGVFSRALFLFGITLPFDIRDLDFDQKTNLKTIPGRVGVKNTKTLSLMLLALFLAIETISHFYYGTSQAVYIALLASGIIAGAFVVRAKPNGSEYYYSFGLEGTMIVQLLLVIVASQCY